MPAKPIILFFIFFAYYNDGLSQDTAKYYYPSGQLKLIQVKMDSSMLYEKEFYDNGQPMTDGYLKFIDGSYRLLNVKASLGWYDKNIFWQQPAQYIWTGKKFVKIKSNH